MVRGEVVLLTRKQARRLNPDAPEFMPSPTRKPVGKDKALLVHPQIGDSEESEPVRQTGGTGGWSDDVEAHEARVREAQRSRLGKSSDPSSEDICGRTSLDHSATTLSTASGNICVQHIDPLDLTDVVKEVGDFTSEAIDEVPHLPQVSEISYKRPRFSRRGQSKSEPSGHRHDSEGEDLLEEASMIVREDSKVDEASSAGDLQPGVSAQGVRHVSAPAFTTNGLIDAVVGADEGINVTSVLGSKDGKPDGRAVVTARSAARRPLTVEPANDNIKQENIPPPSVENHTGRSISAAGRGGRRGRGHWPRGRRGRGTYRRGNGEQANRS